MGSGKPDVPHKWKPGKHAPLVGMLQTKLPFPRYTSVAGSHVEDLMNRFALTIKVAPVGRFKVGRLGRFQCRVSIQVREISFAETVRCQNFFGRKCDA